MISADTAALALSTVISLIAIWVLVGWLYREYRVDLFRHQLFVLRAELFDHALKGEIAFDDPAYVGLRTTLNGFLRFAERINFTSTLLVSLSARRMRPETRAASAMRALDAATDELDPGIRAELIALRSRMHFEVFKQLLFSSPLLIVTLIPFVGYLLMKYAGQRLVWGFFRPAYQKCEAAFERIASPLDKAAFEMGAAL